MTKAFLPIGRAWKRSFNANHESEIAPRLASFPFLSGDLFRAFAEFRLEEVAPGPVDWCRSGVVFAETGQLLRSGGLDSLYGAITSLQKPESARLVIHNGDQVIGEDVLTKISEHVAHIFSVNTSLRSEKVTPLPLGLENAHIGRNGRPDQFWPILESRGQRERIHRVFSSFNVETNRVIRTEAALALEQSRHGHNPQFFTRSEYQARLRTVKFVISPPGNGPDCHRTWEAIYSGAVPVVLDHSLGSNLTDVLPILSVKSYAAFCEFSDQELDALYEEFSQRNLEKALAPYWVSQILKPD